MCSFLIRKAVAQEVTDARLTYRVDTMKEVKSVRSALLQISFMSRLYDRIFLIDKKNLYLFMVSYSRIGAGVLLRVFDHVCEDYGAPHLSVNILRVVLTHQPVC